MDRYPGDVILSRRDDGSVRINEVTPGPMRVSREIAAQADGRWLSLDDDVLTIRGIADDGTPQEYRYRVVGSESYGGENGTGWLLAEPVQ